jgi:hypothetical protein
LFTSKLRHSEYDEQPRPTDNEMAGQHLLAVFGFSSGSLKHTKVAPAAALTF